MVDPICTFLFSILVAFTTVAIIKDTLLVLMEGIPKGIDFNDVTTIFLDIEGVVKVHNLRIWALSLDKTAISAHLAISSKPMINLFGTFSDLLYFRSWRKSTNNFNGGHKEHSR